MSQPPPPRNASQDRPRVGDQVSVEVDRLAYGGEGVGRVGHFVVFVDRAAPGERALVRVRRTHRRHAEADIVSIEQPSPQRITPRCPHFEQGCGGCTWQHLSYEAQLAVKEGIVRDSLERLGGFKDLPLRPILAAPEPWYYRNKMEFAFAAEGGLGLHVRGAWDRVFRLETCYLESELAVSIVKTARDFAEQRGLSLWRPRAHEGFLRELIVREGRGTNEIMIGIVTSPGPFPEGEEMAAHIAALDPRIVSVVRGVRSRPSDGAPIESATVLRGQPHISELVEGVRFRIGLETFFQTNTTQGAALVRLVRELAGPLEGALVFDVFCGVGLFALTLARGAGHVAGVEIVEPAIVAARENAAANGLSNVSFYAGEARKVLPEMITAHGAPKVIVLDPPRAGAGGKVMRRIGRTAPERVVYVSCNPTTLARDLQDLVPFGYRITSVHPVDMFPQTYHVETVVGLERTGPVLVDATTEERDEV